MTVTELRKKIFELVGDDQLQPAIETLRQLLQDAPLLDEAVIQSARYTDLMRQIRLGTLKTQEATVEKNRIRSAVLDLVQEIETAAEARSDVRTELEKLSPAGTVVISNSSNVVQGSLIQAGGNVTLGDTMKHDQE